MFLKLATNDQSDQDNPVDIKTSVPKGLSAPAPGLTTCIETMKKMYAISLEISLQLVANDRSDKRFLLTSKFCPLGLSVLIATCIVNKLYKGK